MAPTEHPSLTSLCQVLWVQSTMSADISIDEFLPQPMSPEEAQKEMDRIFASFSKEFKRASVHLLRTKVLVRLKTVQKEYPDKNPIEQLEMAWAEIALEMLLIMTDALSKSALANQENEEKLKAFAHLMPNTSSSLQ